MGRLVRAAAVAPLAVAALLLGAGPAAADVTLVPDRVQPGARDVTLVFRVTDEPGTRTARIQVFLPTGRPLVGVEADAPPGWAARPTTTELAAPAPTADGPVSSIVTAIEWEATDPAGASTVDLPVRVGLMPIGAGPVRFRVTQTGADGRTVEWADTWAEGATPPAHDALLVRLGDAPARPAVVASHGDHHGEEAAVAASAAAVEPAGPGAIAATVGGLLAFAAAVGALAVTLGRRQRHRFEAVSRRDPGSPA